LSRYNIFLFCLAYFAASSFPSFVFIEEEDEEEEDDEINYLDLWIS
jgi:hypothetical protein